MATPNGLAPASSSFAAASPACCWVTSPASTTQRTLRVLHARMVAEGSSSMAGAAITVTSTPLPQGPQQRRETVDQLVGLGLAVGQDAQVPEGVRWSWPGTSPLSRPV